MLFVFLPAGSHIYGGVFIFPPPYDIIYRHIKEEGMFQGAIEKAGNYTRPIFTILRKFGGTEVLPGSATLFFVNEDAWAVTTKAVAKMILDASGIDKKYAEYLEKKKAIEEGYNYEDNVNRLSSMYQYNEGSVAQLKVNFVGCVDLIKGVQCKLHPTLDLALVHFDGYTKIGYRGACLFAGDGGEAKPGKTLCRMGFPFPEFKNYDYDVEKDDIRWIREGRANTPRFPLSGMVTRLVGSPGGIVGIEIENPGYRGMEGGPVFDEKGVVYGVYSGVSTLGFGMCVHVDRIKEFLRQEKVSYKTDKAEKEKTLKEEKEGEELLFAGMEAGVEPKLN